MADITLSDVQAVYSGPEGILWERLMGEQIHIGGFASSQELARRAGLTPGLEGIDICSALGAGMRFLIRFCGAARMTGIDATPHMVEEARRRCAAEGLDGKADFVLADICDSGLPSKAADFIWGEDAWCYVTDKPRLIAEAARMVRPGGTIAFTDWVVDPARINAEEREHLLTFMKFPNIASPGQYRALLQEQGCEVHVAEDTGRFASHVRLYLALLEGQLRFDALKIIGFNEEMYEGLLGEMRFMQELAEAGKIMQGIFVAVKR